MKAELLVIPVLPQRSQSQCIWKRKHCGGSAHKQVGQAQLTTIVAYSQKLILLVTVAIVFELNR